MTKTQILITVAIFMVLALGACTVTQPIVDGGGAEAQSDLIECRGLAQGGLDGGTIHVAKMTASGGMMMSFEGLGAGMVAGLLTAPLDQERQRAFLVAQCLDGRGWKIVNAGEFDLTAESYCQAHHGRYGWWGDYDGCLEKWREDNE